MKKRFTHVQIITLGFGIIVLLGTALLMLPVSSADGHVAPFREALFTAVSSSCVTGLVLRDTATGWSLFGQAVILVLIQIGGLGFMTIATFLYRLFQKRMSLWSRETMTESINTTNVGGIMRLASKIVLLTLLMEGAGALLLAIRFVPLFGPLRGAWYAVFHAISAFCNAGFDLMGIYDPFGSLAPFRGDALVNLVLMVLIAFGGLGFLVWDDLLTQHAHAKRYKLHTKLVLVTSAVLTFGGAALFFLFERDATGANLPLGERALAALFASVTARTAGFNTVDITAMSSSSKLLTLMLMLVGGSPGSTAGGIKTTSAAVIVLSTLAHFRGLKKPRLFGRSIPMEAFLKSCAILFFNLSLAIVAAMLICASQPIPLVDALFETFSAVGTVGMTTGITRELMGPNAYLVALLMFIGRVGSVSFAVALFEKRGAPRVDYPEEEITVG